MNLWQKVAAAAAMTLGLAGIAPAFAAGDTKEAPKDLVLKEDARCTTCHDEADEPKLLHIGKTRHGVNADKRTPTCVSCHGKSDAHADYKGKDKPPKVDVNFGKNSKVPPVQRNEACLTCHQGGKHINWQSSTHANRGVTCASCHTVHSGQDKVRDQKVQTEVCFSCHMEQRVQVNRQSHHPVPEGKMGCSSCHDVHSDNPKALTKSSTNDTCYSCHMEKRGPFVHNHQPVTEDCAICHNPHGTNAPNLLKNRPPFLCQSCHSTGSHPGQAAGLPNKVSANSTSAVGSVGRGCMNCHTNIHGSNSTMNSATTQRFRR